MPSFAFWTQEQQRDLFKELTGYWAEDIWDLRLCPINLPFGSLGSNQFLKFECPSQNVNTELKYICRKKFIQGDWKVCKTTHSRLHPLLDWIKLCLPASTCSLLERDLHDWEMSYCSFRVAQGRPVDQKRNMLLASQQFKEFTYVHGNVSLLRQLYRELEKTYDTRSEYDKDIWDFRQLGVRVSAGSSRNKANFTLIRQSWLRQLAKTCLRYRLAVYSAGDCGNKLVALTVFSDFLTKHYPNAGPLEITRKLMIEYFGFLIARGISDTARRKYIIELRTILELSVRMGWGNVPKSQVIFDEDIPCASKKVPRFIPDQVLEQIFLHLEELETCCQRMFKVAYGVGMRVGELVSLPFNCLMQDASGDWWIKYYQEKFKQEHTQPILKETAVLIQIQQMEMLEQFGPQPKLLFPNSKGKCFTARRFRNVINAFIVDHNICNASGELWRFQPHQLRHTFGTRHINAGTPPQFVMRMMGHSSVDMSMRYAHIHDQTLKEAFAKFSHKIVDIRGRLIEPEETCVNTSELQWLKKNIGIQPLPNGTCALPIIQKCPHANACLTCTHFRTTSEFLDHHKEQLRRAEDIIHQAKAQGWQRQVEMNEVVAQNLKNIIAALESSV